MRNDQVMTQETRPEREPRTLLTGLVAGESPRWHDGRLWFADWGTHEILAVSASGDAEVVARIPTTFPISIDWLPDGRMLVVSGPEARLLCLEDDGSLTEHADLSLLGGIANEIVTDGRGNAYVNGGVVIDENGAMDARAGGIVLVTPDGETRKVAGDIAFGNGMVITADSGTLIVAESHASRLTAFDIGGDGTLSNRRVWAQLGEAAPDGICLDATGAVWYADVPHQQCVRVRAGGTILDTISVDRGCFACMLGGDDGRVLFILAVQWRGFETMTDGKRTGRLLVADAPAAHVGCP